MGGSYELVEKLWAQLPLTAWRVNTEVTWTRDEVMIGSVKFPVSLRLIPGFHCCFDLSQSF